MNLKRAVGRRAVGIGTIVVCLGAVLFLCHSWEPRYDGKTLHAWLRLGKNVRSPSFIQASNAICAIGTNAFPYLLRLVQRKDSDLPRPLAWLAARQSLLRFEPAQEMRSDAVTGFVLLGPAALPAIPDLARIAVEQKNDEAGFCVIHVARPAAPILMQMLKNQDRRYRQFATSCLMHLDCDIVEDLVPVLLQQMQDDDWKTRCFTGYELECYFNPPFRRSDPPMPVLQPRTNMPDQRIFYDALIPRLQDTQPEVRVMAVGLLGRLRTAAKPAIPLITERLADPDPSVRYYATNALNLINGKADGTLPQ